MDKEQKTLKSPLSAKFCPECMAKVAGEAQKSLAREVLSRLEIIETHIDLRTREKLLRLKNLLKQIIG
ncbi:MAG: hypothetical protein E3J76_02810 [Candidatus Aminicenantes bacterium]|nr:MAG: hypothetical protein E3J76_02810 [Candidatus Aminicenantes bacterium]